MAFAVRLQSALQRRCNASGHTRLMDAVTMLLGAIERGDTDGLADAFAPNAILDATIPHWRFSVTGADAIADQLASWFAEPGVFEELHRTPLHNGELVEFVLTWHENGVPHAVHQAHIVKLAQERIVEDVMFCGGRWPAELLAEMEAARARSPIAG